MNALLDRLRVGSLVLMDGAMGTELQRRGARPDVECLELWNVTRPDDVRAVHRAYLDAGAECLLTHTFQANPPALSRHGLAHRLDEIWHAALRNARATAGGRAWVLADVGPLQNPRRRDLWPVLDACRGADALLLETWSSLLDLEIIGRLNEARLGPRLPLIVSFTFRRVGPFRELRTFQDATPEECASAAHQQGAIALGVNCGADLDPAALCDVVRRYAAVTDLPLLVRPNAGTPRVTAEGTAYPLTPDALAAGVAHLQSAGAMMLGGCCGTTPDHIAAFSRALGR